MRRRNLTTGGFGVIGIVVLTLVLSTIVFMAWRLYGSVASPDTSQDPRLSQAVTDFYTCWDRIGSISDTKPATCNFEGRRYTAPSTFSDSQVLFLEQAPQGVRPQLIEAARQVFNTCQAGKVPASRPIVTIAQDNFAAIRLGCDTTVQRAFGLESGKWQAIAGSSLALGCEVIDRYGLTRASYIGGMTEDNDLCLYADGSSKQIPQ